MKLCSLHKRKCQSCLEKLNQLLMNISRYDNFCWVSIKSQNKRLWWKTSRKILKVIGVYLKVLDLLDDNDHTTLKKIEKNINDKKIEYQIYIFSKNIVLYIKKYHKVID